MRAVSIEQADLTSGISKCHEIFTEQPDFEWLTVGRGKLRGHGDRHSITAKQIAQ